jgi:ribosomal protection tetracycline resistance protein
MHVESYIKKETDIEANQKQTVYSQERSISLEEIDQIMNKTFYANQGKKSAWKRQKTAAESYYKPVNYTYRQEDTKEEYLLVDGYNIIFAWPELKKLADDNMDSAKMKLLDLLSNYQWIRNCQIIVVFDAYRVEGHREEVIDYYNIHMVYTREAQTADQYIEKFAHDNKKNYKITVATSDGLQQIIVRGEGCGLLSARELKAEVIEANEKLQQKYQKIPENGRNYLGDTLSHETKMQIEGLTKNEDDK